MPSTQRVWPVGMERPAPSRAADGTDRAALFGRELDRVRRPGQLMGRDSASARPERPEGSREGQDERRAEARPDSAPTGELTAPPSVPVTAPADPEPFAAPVAPAGDAEGPAAPVPAENSGTEAPGGDRAPNTPVNPQGAPAAGTRSAPAAAQASLALPGARVVETPALGPAALNTAAARRDVPRVQTAAAPAATFGAVLEQIQAELRPNLRQALVVLEPADLGRVAVRLRMGHDGLTAALRAESPETRELLERHLPELRASFEASGIHVREITVELDARSNSQHPPGSGQQGSPQSRPSSGAARATSESAQTSTPRSGTRPDGSVDTYA